MLFKIRRSLHGGGPTCVNVDTALSRPELIDQEVQVIGHVAPLEELVQGPFEPRQGVAMVVKVHNTTLIMGSKQSAPLFTAKAGVNFKVSDTLGQKNLMVDVESAGAKWRFIFKSVNIENNIEYNGANESIMSGGIAGHKRHQTVKPDAQAFFKHFGRTKKIVMQDKTRHSGVGRLKVAVEEVLHAGDAVAVTGLLRQSPHGPILVAGSNAMITNDETFVPDLASIGQSLASFAVSSCKTFKMVHKALGIRPARVNPGADDDLENDGDTVLADAGPAKSWHNAQLGAQSYLVQDTKPQMQARTPGTVSGKDELDVEISPKQLKTCGKGKAHGAAQLTEAQAKAASQEAAVNRLADKWAERLKAQHSQHDGTKNVTERLKSQQDQHGGAKSQRVIVENLDPDADPDVQLSTLTSPGLTGMGPDSERRIGEHEELVRTGIQDQDVNHSEEVSCKDALHQESAGRAALHYRSDFRPKQQISSKQQQNCFLVCCGQSAGAEEVIGDVQHMHET